MKWLHTLSTLLLVCMVSFPSHAVWLAAGLLSTDSDDQPLSSFTVSNFLKKTKPASGPKAVYTIDFEETLPGHSANRMFVEALSESIKLTPEIKHQIAEHIAATLGDVCELDALSLNMFVAHDGYFAELIHDGKTTITSDWRLERLSIFDCVSAEYPKPLNPMPEACGYAAYENDESGLDLNGLLEQISDCGADIRVARAEQRKAARYGRCYTLVQALSGKLLDGGRIKVLPQDTPLPDAPANCVGDDDGTTPLMAAAENARAEVVSELLSRGAQGDTRDVRGRSALVRAAIDCPGKIAEWRIRHLPQGLMPLQDHLAQCGRIISALRAAGSKAPEPLQITSNPCASMAYFSLKGSESLQTVTIIPQSVDGDQALMVLSWFLDQGISANCQIQDGHGEIRSPLDIHTGFGDVKGVKLLLERGASVVESPDLGGGDRLAGNLRYCAVHPFGGSCSEVESLLRKAGWKAPDRR